MSTELNVNNLTVLEEVDSDTNVLCETDGGYFAKINAEPLKYEEGAIPAANNIFGVDIPYYHIGKLVVVVIGENNSGQYCKLNKIPSITACASQSLFTLPETIIPNTRYRFTPTMDSAWSASNMIFIPTFWIEVRPNREVHFVCRGNSSSNFSGLGDGYSISCVLTFICE